MFDHFLMIVFIILNYNSSLHICFLHEEGNITNLCIMSACVVPDNTWSVSIFWVNKLNNTTVFFMYPFNFSVLLLSIILQIRDIRNFKSPCVLLKVTKISVLLLYTLIFLVNKFKHKHQLYWCLDTHHYF